MDNQPKTPFGYYLRKYALKIIEFYEKEGENGD